MSSPRLIVMKFGGTSVGDASRFRQCAAIVSKALKKDRVIVVVSAMAGVTDLIFRTIDAARHGDSEKTEAHLRTFETAHRKLISELLEQRADAEADGFVADVFEHLRKSAHALLALRSDISPRTMDSLVALGERISSWVLAKHLEQIGVESAFIFAEDVIVTDANFGNAAPDMEATRAKCQSALVPLAQRGVAPIIGGYSGA